MTRLLDGRALARAVRADVAAQVAEQFPDPATAPGLATVLVGDDPASAAHVATKRRAAVGAGLRDLHRALPQHAAQEDVAQLVDELGADPAVSGVLLQLPLPAGLDAAPLLDRIPVGKDVDGLTTASAGRLARGERGLRPCTPSGVIELLDAAGVVLDGARAVVVGRSELVGRPMAAMLLERDATVSVAHRRTRDLAALTSTADVLVVAAGVPGLIGAEHVRAGAAVVDVGLHRTADGLVGDVRSTEVDGVAGHLTPVPGGVGPMTVAMLVVNTLRAAQWARSAPL